MRPIRSLLWIGSGLGLVESGMTESPELDITWVPNLKNALALPRVVFEGVFFEAESVEEVERSLAQLSERLPGVPVLVCLPRGLESRSAEVLEAGAAAAFFRQSNDLSPGIVTEVGETLDAIHETRIADTKPSTPQSPRNAARAAANVRDGSPVQDSTRSSISEPDGLGPERVVTSSAAMSAVFDLVDRAASSPSTVLLTGETGVGKEVIARELHARSVREDEPFVAINCAAFPESLLESELFGHTKGAFTGADRPKIGLFEAAGTGTLFLDEIAEMGLPLQAKLLRVLQEREIRPVGGTRQIKVRCRIIAATNRVLAKEVQAGHFREDLFYRLNVFPIRIPPLRERKAEVLPLARHFLALHGPREGKTGCHLSLASGQLLEGYAWPGNVRELENEILRALMLTPSGQLVTPKGLSPKIVEILEPIAQGARPEESLKEALDRVEAWMIRRALANNDGRRTRTAKKLGLTREGLYKKMKRLGVE
jgi:transcriptional regulator with PAS, ATPase and Fis domain